MKPAPPVTKILRIIGRSPLMCGIAVTLLGRGIGKAHRCFRQRTPSTILGGQHRALWTYWPGDAERRVVPGDAAVMLGRVVVTRFVEHFGIRLQRAEAVCEAERNEQLIRQRCSEHHRDRTTESR